jgi:hypothetical protein
MEDFADYIVERVEKDEDLFLTVIGKFEEIKNFVKEVVLVAEVDFESLEMQSPEINDYHDEYILDCWCNNGIVMIGCEPAKRNGKYLNLTGDETYLFDNCSSKIIPLCECSKLCFISIEDERDCDGECDDCCPCDCHGGDSCAEYSKTDGSELHGFTAIKPTDNGYHSYIFYTSGKLSKNDIQDVLNKFGFRGYLLY